jgi:hypothetical protein
MNPKMSDPEEPTLYHTPSELEQQFLRVVTRGYPELELQIEACEVADYDPDGWLKVRVTNGPRIAKRMVPGPFLQRGDYEFIPLIDINLLARDGLLNEIEFVDYGVPAEDPYRSFVDAAKCDPDGPPPRLLYCT